MKNQATAVVIGYVWPEPNSSAAGQNMLHLLQHLKNNNFRVVFMSAASSSPHAVDLPSMGIEQYEIALNCSSFDNLIATISPDVVVFDRYMTEEQFSARVFKTCPSAVRVLNTEDLHFLRKARHDAVKHSGSVSDIKLNTELCHRELACILRSDITLLVSEYEKSLLREQFCVPAKQLFLQQLPVTRPSVSLPTFSERKDFVFIGNFRHAPNWDAVLQLKQAIWPLLSKAVPEANLRIYGAYPPKKATQLHNPASRFYVEGWCEDADEVVRNARVLLAPLRFGAGVKGKLLSAMALNTPSITTEIGAEGICSSDNWPGFVCASAEEFIEQATQLYQDEARWLRLSERSQKSIEGYLAHHEDDQLSRLLKALLADIQSHRANLYHQGMLWHHTLTSSHYMGQWIEAKNKNAG